MSHKTFIDIVIKEHCKSTLNNDYRINKINKYINKRSALLDCIITNLSITIPITKLIKWYDLFYDYSTMELVDKSKYWIIMRKLNNYFAQWESTIHSILFYIYCIHYPTQITITEFLVSLLLFNDDSEYFIKLQDEVIKNIFEHINKLPNIKLSDDIIFYIKLDTNLMYKITTKDLYHIYNNRIKYPNEYNIIMKSFIGLNKINN